MLYCPNGHGPKGGHFCDDCGAKLVAELPAGDSLRIRSAEAHVAADQDLKASGEAHVNVFVQSGGWIMALAIFLLAAGVVSGYFLLPLLTGGRSTSPPVIPALQVAATETALSERIALAVSETRSAERIAAGASLSAGGAATADLSTTVAADETRVAATVAAILARETRLPTPALRPTEARISTSTLHSTETPTPTSRPTETRTPSPTLRPTETATVTPSPTSTGFPTPPRPYQIPERGRLEEQEPNNTFSRANLIYFGERVWGDIDPVGDVDYYTFDAPANVNLIVDINAAVEGSLLDSFLKLWNEFGRLEATNDNDGSTTDSRINYRIGPTGTYYVEVRSAVPNVGGTKYLYELVLLPSNIQPPGLPTPVPARGEQEPNDTPSQGNKISIGDTIWGAIGKPRDVDFFCFKIDRQRRVIIDINAVFEGSALESALTLWDDLGNRIRGPVTGDGSSTDSRIGIDLSPGTYCAELRSKDAGKGSSSYIYVLRLR